MKVDILMRCLLLSAGMLLRRRCSSGPLLLLGVALCLFYHTLMVARNRLRGGLQPAAEPRGRKVADDVLLEEETRRLISALEALQKRTQVSLPAVASPTQHTRSRPFIVLMNGRLTPGYCSLV